MASNKKTLIGVGLGLLAVVLIAKKKPKETETPIDTGGTWTNPTNATITYEVAQDIAKKIKAAIGYWLINWDDIANQFLRLRNDKDVELLYKAFGTWDGPVYINGDLFNALNNAKQTINQYLNPNALKIIKQYSFTYGKYYTW